MFGRIRRRHDPFWDDGQGARRTHRRVQFEGLLAIAIAIVACGLTTAVWLRTLAPLGESSACAEPAHLTRPLARPTRIDRDARATMALLTTDARPQEGPMRTLITNGTIVTADGSYAADVLIDGETIVADRRATSPAPASPPTRRSTRPASTSSRAASTSTPTWSCRSAGRSPRTRSRPGRGPRPSAGRPRSSTSPSSRAARRCARASTRGTPRPRATPSPTTAST